LSIVSGGNRCSFSLGYCEIMLTYTRQMERHTRYTNEYRLQTTD
jgi:hypothetical protein